MHENLQDLKASGSARLGGGTYRNVNVSGSAYIDGDVACEAFVSSGSVKVAGGVKGDRFKASGSARIEGNASVGEFRVGGTASVGGNLDAKELLSSGTFKVEGDVTAKNEVKLSGISAVGGAIRAGTLHATGSLKAAKGIECEALTLSGAFEVGGLINAGTADISLAGQSRIDEIGGERVSVRRGGIFGALGIPLPLELPFGLGGFLTADSIEATCVFLEFTRAKVVRGAEVTIGSGCEIDRAEYSVSLDVAEDAVVRERIKVD
ncbi:polymer-forming cytoskeletal protein [Bacillota bacterium Meth-B3]